MMVQDLMPDTRTASAQDMLCNSSSNKQLGCVDAARSSSYREKAKTTGGGKSPAGCARIANFRWHGALLLTSAGACCYLSRQLIGFKGRKARSQTSCPGHLWFDRI
eukprot:19646-Heterococcus_DN1.PRE.1